jgi:hypothetical protein
MLSGVNIYIIGIHQSQCCNQILVPGGEDEYGNYHTAPSYEKRREVF